ncbi:MAG: T9SS C-terminal target domain-containing protein [Bacteroidetes bacterium]|nr:T9SS C-terminal target domain-containing protein [Bacteroidota bacterium]
MKNINEILDWCKVKNIKIETYDYWANELYSKIPNQNVNIAPSLNVDLDEDGLPDGFGNLNTFDPTTGVAQSGGKSFSGKNGQVITIQRLGGVEKGKNVIRLSTKGGSENDKVNIFINVQDKNINYYFDVPANTPDFTEYSKEFWIPEDAFLISVYCNVYSPSGRTIFVSGLDIRGVSKPKIKFKKLTKQVNQDFPLIELDKCVFDTAFAANSMKWGILKDALSFAKLDTINRKLIIMTNPFWLGNDSIQMIVMNPSAQADTCTLYFSSTAMSVCAGQLLELKAPFDSTVKYKWTAIPADSNLKNDTGASIAVRPIISSVYKLLITQSNNMAQSYTIDVNVRPSRSLNTEMDTLIYNPLQDNIFELNKPFGYSFSILSQAKYNVELSNNVLKTLKGQSILGDDLVRIYVSNKTCDVGIVDLHIMNKKSSITELEIDKNLKVYPNPVSDYLKIKTPNGNAYDLVLMEFNGQIVKRSVIDQNSTGLDMMDIPKGFYILYLSNQIISDRHYFKIFRN